MRSLSRLMSTQLLVLQPCFNLLSQGSRDALDAGQFLDARLADALGRAEVFQQGLLALRADAGQVVERGAERALAALLAVEGDREAVRLVADALHQEERLRV